MEKLGLAWKALDMRRRLIFGGGFVAALAAMLALGQMAAKPGMALLYSGLDAAAAGEVVGALEQMQVPSEVRGDAIYVAADSRDRVRLALARDGIPRQGQAGYELLDEISGFSATTDMFDAAFWRAREGELARTILASPGVRAARVHIAAPSRRPFARSTAGPTASVTITMSGGTLGVQQATAFRYLVALAVAGLEPEQVAVIDSRAGMVLAPGVEGLAIDANAQGIDREKYLKTQIEELLEARVGRDKVRVSVTVETEREAQTVSERILQPDTRVTIHSDTEEVTETDSGSNPSVTVASNLPAGEAAQGSERQSSRSETREKANYDYSEVRRETVRQPGAVKRISVAVLVDGVTTAGEAGAPVWQPRPAEELAALRDLVIAAVGFDEARGDTVTVESLPFQPSGEAGEMAEASSLGRFVARNAMQLVQIAVLAGVVLVLAFSVIRPVLAAGAATREIDAPPALAPAQTTLAIAGEARQDDPDAREAEARERTLPDRDSLLRVVAERPELSAAMLRDWLETSDEEAA